MEGACRAALSPALSKYEPTLGCSQEVQLPNWSSSFLTWGLVVSSWPVPSLAMLSAHLLCSRYGPLLHSDFSLGPGMRNAPVKLVPRQLSWSPHQPVLLALRLCFLHLLWLAPGIVPHALARTLGPLLLAWNIFSSWLSSSHCHLPRSLSLPYLEMLFSQSLAKGHS